jgi:RNA polymerase sigma factor (sigma-70 family)
MTAAPGPASAIAVSRELDRVMRADRGRLLAILAAGLRDLGLAEEVLQEAAVSAVSHWGRSGLPVSPSGWLLQVARRKAIDRLRRAARDSRKAQALAMLARDEAAPDPQTIPDERLRLIFACCHPALEPKSRVALTLRTVCGLTTPEIARAFLDAEPTMGQRISRAKAKIAAAGIPFSVPEAEHWPERLDTVLTTVYLIFTTGYVAGPDEPRDLCLEAEYLIRLIEGLRPGDAEIEGALAMMLLTAARRAARIGPDGASLPPGEQDRSLWDADRIAEGREVLARAMGRRRPGPFQIKAAIADCQMADPGPDWPQIVALYGALLRQRCADRALRQTATRGRCPVSQPIKQFKPWSSSLASTCRSTRRTSASSTRVAASSRKHAPRAGRRPWPFGTRAGASNMWASKPGISRNGSTMGLSARASPSR